MRKLALIAAICFSTLLPAHAQDQDAFWPSEVSILNTRQIAFVSLVNHEPFTISISIPLNPPPKGGYPVLYVLDGEAYAATAASFSIILQQNAAVVVGIGHNALNDKKVALQYAGRAPNDNRPVGIADAAKAFNRLRVLDLTLPLSAQNRAPVWFDSSQGEGGDVDAFLKVIETEIKPRVAAIVPVNTANQALFGHSLGGLAVIRALFKEPSAFKTFIASSPSLWWNGDAILADEKSFAAMVEANRAAPRVLITSAEREDAPPADYSKLPPERATELAAYLKLHAGWLGMVTGAKGLADRLEHLHGQAPYKVEYDVIPDVDHPASPYTAVGRGMHFAFDQ